jgi:hypothetical protein
MADPSSFISNPPSTVVKVVNTSRAEVNGLLGIAVQFDAGRGRYLIHMVNDQQTMALKPENLVKASTVESIKAQYQQFQNDPRMKAEIQKYCNLIQTKTGIKPQYLGGAVLVVIAMAIYWFGFSKTLMLLSTMLLLAVLAGPDLVQGADYKTVLRNFPMRSREAIEQSAPFLKGRITNPMAAGLVAVMVVFSLQSLIFGGGARKVTAAAAAATAKGTTSSLAAISADQLEQAYKLGFDDATNGKEFGFSTVETLIQASKLAAMDAELDDEFSAGGYASTTTMTPPPQRSFISKIGFSQAMSVFYLYRTAMEIGTDADGRFSPQLFLAQVQTQEVWKLGILGFTIYNLLKVFL